MDNLNVGVVSIFPEMLKILDLGIMGKAQQKHLLSINCWNPRDFTRDKRGNVDDRPYGGGPGMVMLYEPLVAAIDAAKTALGTATRTVYLSPQGQQVTQHSLQAFLDSKQSLLLVAGRYEGIDERVIELNIDEEWSLGDIVLSGGEIAAVAIIDAMARLIPGVLGHEDSAAQDSFMNGLLDYPHYTRPETIAGLSVPEVLLSGDHAAIARWRLKQALGRSWLRRPDLIAKKQLSEQEQQLLNEFRAEYIRS